MIKTFDLKKDPSKKKVHSGRNIQKVSSIDRLGHQETKDVVLYYFLSSLEKCVENML